MLRPSYLPPAAATAATPQAAEPCPTSPAQPSAPPHRPPPTRTPPTHNSFSTLLESDGTAAGADEASGRGGRGKLFSSAGAGASSSSSSSSGASAALTEQDGRALELFREGLVGRLERFSTPYGIKPLVYADWTASGRAHTAVESFVVDQVLPR